MTSLLDLGDSDSGPATPRLEGVGVVRRGAARLVDFVVMAAVWYVAAPFAFALAFAWAGFFGPAGYAALEKLIAASESGDYFAGVTLVERLIDLAAVVVMHSFWEGLHGSTVGKRLLGVTVVSEDGTPASFGQGVKRSVAFLVDQLFFGLLGAHRIHQSPRAQRIGDEWADTMVVRIRDLAPAARRSGLRFAAALLAGCVAGGFVIGLGTSAWIAYHAWLGASDRVAIVTAVHKQGGPFRAGDTVDFVIGTTFDLRSAPLGTQRLVVYEDGVPMPAGERGLMRGRGVSNFQAQVKIPEHRPGYAQPGVVRLGVALFPAENIDAPSAQHIFDVAIVPCDPMAEGDRAGLLCVG